ncbi:hypothetical protein LX16_3813 [Stackebrandtia albiflava]|uniref:Antibiotic biosynthesis monooxygenase n=2 Tax=Stackebrandtia albiflava TaxID=406432 RepID=A0A562V5A9_9ACTN|nr:hypothetical protein LX16_3813 [Stackebrandtia albiflava]
MWEVRAEPAGFDALVEWVRHTGVPAVAARPGFRGSEVYRSEDHRLVVISHWDTESADLPEPPEGLAARPPHAWDFTRIG